MKLVLFGTTALSLLLTVPDISERPLAGGGIVQGSFPTSEALSYLARRYPQIKGPVHLLADTARPSRDLSFVCHSSGLKLPKASFIQASHGIYVPVPALCLAQVATQVERAELMFLGTVLCGAFFLDPRAHNGLGNRPPLASRRSVTRYLERIPGLHGSKAARMAAHHLLEGAASPPEALLGLALASPSHFGGFNLPEPSLNAWIALNARGREIMREPRLKPDLCWQESKLAIEYDSNSEHLTPKQIARDATRKLALEACGYKVVSVTARQMASPLRLEGVAREAARALGIRLRIRNPRFPQLQRVLLRAPRLLGDLIAPLSAQVCASAAQGSSGLARESAGSVRESASPA